MNITILCVGGLKENYLREGCAEYEKRLRRFGKMTVIEVEEVRGQGERQEIEKEGEALLKKIRPGDYVVALCVEGKQMDSLEFSRVFQQTAQSGKSSITFVIGGSDGLAHKVKEAAHMRLSFSKMTMPHQLMRLVLLEQIYRAFKIQNGERYHK